MQLLFLASAAQQNSLDLNVTGSAFRSSGNCFTLTPPEKFKMGAVWSKILIDLGQDFSIEGNIYLGSRDSSGADGIAFVLHPAGVIMQNNGGGMGYSGMDPSLAIEFDTWQNDDPPFDHIALVKDGNTEHFAHPEKTLQGPFELLPNAANAEDGRSRPFRISWNAGTKTLQCFYDGQLRINYSGNIIDSVFGGNTNIIWGFTGATGGFFNEQRVCIENTSLTEIQGCVKPGMLYIPNAFTPNGDQLNDRFYPLGAGLMVLRFSVYSRWGQLVHDARNFPVNDSRFGWDGNWNGKRMEKGAYVYVLLLECNNTVTTTRGTITLLR